MRFLQFINESFNKVQDYKLTRDTLTVKHYKFNINDMEYLVTFNRDIFNDVESEWECAFRFITGSNDEAKFKITNTGNYMIVFATVISIMKDFLKTFDNLIGSIIFTANIREPSRIKLYDTMMSKFKLTFPNLYFKREYTIGSDVLYTIGKKHD